MKHRFPTLRLRLLLPHGGLGGCFRLFVLILISFSPSGDGGAFAQQYQKQREAAVKQNAPLASFAAQRHQLFNFDWRFQLVADAPDTQSPPSLAPAQPDYDDSAWRRLDLPHDFQFEMPWTEESGGARGFKPMCQGWYRKTFMADTLWRGKEVLLDFGGIMYIGDVYINGVKVASSEYGYIGFEADITRHLRYDRPNVVAVWASTGPKNGSRWYTGGGLFRDVYLKLQNPTHITRHGVFVEAPLRPLATSPKGEDSKRESAVKASPLGEVPEGRRGAFVSVTAEVTGWKKHEHPTIRARVLSPDGRVLGTTQQEIALLTKHTYDEISLPEVVIDNPELWSPESPSLYTAQVVVEADGIVVDSTEQRFGIRSIEFGPDFGFRLNGKKVFLKGIANHHDMGAVGVAAYDDAVIRQMLQLKRFGFNAIRCSHNPYSERFTQLADSLGLIIVDELIDKWSDRDYWGGRKPFMSLWPQYIPEWVKRDRNSPSVVMWSLGNELQTRADWSGYPTNDWGITTYRIFDQMVKRYDPTRPTTVAMFPARAGAIREEKEFKTYLVPPELACQTEVASFNYQWDAYHGYFDCKPDLILFQSEAVTNQLQAPFYGMDRNRTVGLAYWGAIEYWGESNKWPKKGWNYSFFRHTLQPHPQAYLIKSIFQPDQPVVRIGVLNGGESLNWNDVNVGQKTYADHWNHRLGSHQQVVTFTNGDEVELYVNGQLVGRQTNDTTDVFRRNIITWQDVPYGQGGNIEAVAYTDGREVTRQRIETAGEAVRLIIEEEESTPAPRTMKADGMSLRYFTVKAVDKKGRVVPDYTEKLNVMLEGDAATLLAIDNADHFTDDLFLDVTEKPMMNGRMQVILRSSRHPGKVILKVQSGKLSAKWALTVR